MGRMGELEKKGRKKRGSLLRKPLREYFISFLSAH
jgi:hypothetical protein